MKLPVIALALSTLFSASCTEKVATRTVVLTPDPAKLSVCPRSFPVPPTLAPIQSFVLPDGREVVLFDTVLARETATARYIIKSRGVWYDCASTVTYVEDFSREVTKP
jgi:hypothetical protein